MTARDAVARELVETGVGPTVFLDAPTVRLLRRRGLRRLVWILAGALGGAGWRQR